MAPMSNYLITGGGKLVDLWITLWDMTGTGNQTAE